MVYSPRSESFPTLTVAHCAATGDFVIYSKFGSKLTLLGRLLDNNGRLAIQATAEGATQVREYQVGDLKADDGQPEISQAIEKLPWHVQHATVRRSR